MQLFFNLELAFLLIKAPGADFRSIGYGNDISPRSLQYFLADLKPLCGRLVEGNAAKSNVGNILYKSLN
jgi:hypothetical protein